MTGDASYPDISDLTDDEVWRLLMADRLGPQHDWSKLIADDPVRIRSILIQRINDVSHQLSARRSELDVLHGECMSRGPAGKQRYFDAKTDYEEWRVGAIRFKRHAEGRAAELKRAIDRHRASRHSKEMDSRERVYREIVRRLALAIAAHQSACTEDRIQPSRADLKLWGLLDEITVDYGAKEATLADMVDLVWD